MIPAAILPNVAFVAIRAYAAYSYLYYDRDESLISDADFDALCKWLLRHYDVVKPHDLNDYLDPSSLEAGTGYNLAGKVCGMTRKWADALLAEKDKPVRKAAKKKTALPAPDLSFLD